jgi:hypothetical protein
MSTTTVAPAHDAAGPEPVGQPLPAVQQAVGELPLLTLLMAAGLLVIAFAGTGARAGAAWAEPLFWTGLAVLALPALARLIGTRASDQERLGLVVAFGVALYVIKILHSPVAFTFPDEFIHQHNVNETVQQQHLFGVNTIQPVSTLYPGLASATSALISLSGLSDFAAGLLMSALARVIFLLAMFLLVERVSGSARVAGLTSALYAANPNFLFYSAEFGYEQIALPLAALAIYAVMRRVDAREPVPRFGWTVVALGSILAVTVTHHLTAYGLVIALWAICLLFWAVLKQAARAPWDLAAIGLLAATAWIGFVATPTVVYLGQILGGATTAGLQLLSTGQNGRQLFQASSGGFTTPLWEQALGVGSVLLIVVGLPFGLLHVWRHYRTNAFALLLGGAAVLYPPVQLLRLTQVGWETANRSSEFLFVGVGFVLALVLVHLDLRVPTKLARWAVPVMTVYAAVIFGGGVVAGWRSDLRLPWPYLVSAGGPAIEPQGASAARWTRAALGTEIRFAADPSSAFYLMDYGDQRPLTGDALGIRSLFFTRTIDRSVSDIVTQAGVRYLSFDRRLISWNPLLGIYPARPGPHPADEDALIDPDAISKFDNAPQVSRILDTGDIVIYDLGGLSGTPRPD